MNEKLMQDMLIRAVKNIHNTRAKHRVYNNYCYKNKKKPYTFYRDEAEHELEFVAIFLSDNSALDPDGAWTILDSRPRLSLANLWE